MNWINMLPWYQWVVLGLVPPLIFMLYFLKLKRIPVEVPSTYLWIKTVEDLHVNSIWQKLRKNILLLLQLLAALMLLVSCLSPGCEGTKLSGNRFIFLVDQSASMSATDTESGISRLDESKKQIYTLIDRMSSTDAAMVISFSDSAQVVQSYTTRKAILKRKVKSIPQTERGSDMKEALLNASGLANPGRTSDRNSKTDVQVAESVPAKMFIFSDGAVKKIPTFNLGVLTPEYRPIGGLEPPTNIGITAFSINDQIDGGGQVQVFARIQNSGMEDKEVGISMFVGGDLKDARQITVPGLGGVAQNFDVTAFIPGLEKATPIKLQIDDKDIYMQDNVAHCVLNPPRISRILVVSDFNRMDAAFSYLRLALNTGWSKKLSQIEYEDRDFLKDPKFKENAALGTYDLVIFDQCSPEEMPLSNTVFWGALPPGDRWKSLEDLETAPVVDSDASHPLMFGVVMGNVHILTAQTLEGPQGSVPLVSSPTGSIMSIAPRGGFEDLVIGFPLVEVTESGDVSNNTNWTHESFPLFMQNMMATMASTARFNATKTNSPGALVKIRPQFPYPAIDVKTPEGRKTTVKARSDNSFVFTQTAKSGIYEVFEKGADEAEQLFAVNLLDRTESDLAVREKLNLGYEEVLGTTSSEPARKDFWPWLVLAALIFITVEWYIYNRRVFI
ncbi:MAG: BatA and WFA domain-containing protein [Mariniblastus sp.]